MSTHILLHLDGSTTEVYTILSNPILHGTTQVSYFR